MIALAVICVGLIALNAFQLHLASKREDEHREERASLVASVMVSKGVPFIAPTKEPAEAPQQFDYSPDGLDAWPVTTSG